MNLEPARIVVSLFPGVGLLDRAFEEAGFVVLRGPDKIFGGDVRRFRLPAGFAWGIIGGPPCQDFSARRRDPPTGYGLEMLEEFCRVVREAAPEWYLCENVARVPTIKLPGYCSQRIDVDQKWYVDVSRLRHIQFGSRSGRLLHIDRPTAADSRRARHARGHGSEPDPSSSSHAMAPSHTERSIEPAALACDKRKLEELVRLQGLPTDFALPDFTVGGAKRAIGNGVPLPMGRALAAAILETYRSSVTPDRLCSCPCRRRLTGRQTYYDVSCRKRAERERRKRDTTAANL